MSSQPGPPSDPGSDPERTPDTAPDPDRLRRLARMRLLSDGLLVAVCAWLLVRDAGSALSLQVEPKARGFTFLLNLTATFVVVHRGVSLLQRLMPQARHRAVGIAKWVLALTLPVLVAGQLERMTHAGHRALLDGVAREVAARIAKARAAGREVGPADLEGLGTAYRVELSVHREAGTFVLDARVPALDADGYTARYSSTDRRWQLLGTDEQGTASQRAGVNGEVLYCQARDGTTTCR